MTVKMRNELSSSEVQELHDRLARRLDGKMVSTLPHVAQKVLRLVGDPESSLRDYGAVIKADQALTAKLIRMSNSALYAQRNPATTIERAMIVLGLSRLKAVVLGFQLVNAGGSDALSKRRWSEAVMRGWLAHAITSEFSAGLAGEAFIIGLMLDSGVPLMAQLLGEKYTDLVSSDLAPGKAFAIENTRLPFTHADVGAAMAKVWNFPSSLAVPIARHHDTLSTPDLTDSEQLLRSAAYYTGSVDLSHARDGDEPDADRFLPSVAQRVFGIPRERLQAIIHRACDDYAATREMFGTAIDQNFEVDSLLREANESLIRQVDELVARIGTHADDSGVRTLEACGRRLMFSLVGPGRLRAVVTDTEGKPLFVDEVMPMQQSVGELRSALLLEEAGEHEFAALLDQIRSLAA
ncbi:MAG: HDOD domain-containing protein [Phycisphaerales bacterium]